MNKSLDSYKAHPVEFFLVERVNGEFVPEKIQIKEMDLTEEQKSLIGKQFKGIVKNIKDYGAFIKMENNHEALLHKSNMPKELANTFQQEFHIGLAVKVEVLRITKKGTELKYIEL